jgi:hypothetical protein
VGLKPWRALYPWKLQLEEPQGNDTGLELLGASYGTPSSKAESSQRQFDYQVDYQRPFPAAAAGE